MSSECLGSKKEAGVRQRLKREAASGPGGCQACRGQGKMLGFCSK